MELAAALGLGLILGAATGIPLGVVNVAVVEAATRGGARHAAAIGLGGALADGAHAFLAFAGLATLVTDELRAPLLLVSATTILGYAALLLRRRGVAPAARPPRAGRGIAIGLALTLPNPAPLLAWVAVGAALVRSPDIAVAAAGALGVTLGSAAWFALLARLAARGRLDDRAARWLPRLVALALAAFALAALLQALASRCHTP